MVDVENNCHTSDRPTDLEGLIDLEKEIIARHLPSVNLWVVRKLIDYVTAHQVLDEQEVPQSEGQIVLTLTQRIKIAFASRL